MYILNRYFRKNFAENLVIGLTGNIGAGKSFVLSYFKKQGFFTLSADELVNEEYAKKSSFLRIYK